MKNRNPGALFTVVAFFALLSLTAPAGIWNENVEDALATARRDGKTVLLTFTGIEWCISCRKLEKEVLSRRPFKKYAEADLVCVKVLFPKNEELDAADAATSRELMKKYRIEAFPTVVLLDGDGSEIGRCGYREGGAEKFVEHLRTLIHGEEVANE